MKLSTQTLTVLLKILQGHIHTGWHIQSCPQTCLSPRILLRGCWLTCRTSRDLRLAKVPPTPPLSSLHRIWSSCLQTLPCPAPLVVALCDQLLPPPPSDRSLVSFCTTPAVILHKFTATQHRAFQVLWCQSVGALFLSPQLHSPHGHTLAYFISIYPISKSLL